MAETLELCLLRYRGTKGFTAGRLFIDGIEQCYTLEDQERQIEGQPTSKWKVYGETAIPRGRYKIELTYSPTFKRLLPILIDVEGFTYIRMHSGNKVSHTHGCPLLGAGDNNNKDAWNGNSRVAERALMAKLKSAKEKNINIYITIV